MERCSELRLRPQASVVPKADLFAPRSSNARRAEAECGPMPGNSRCSAREALGRKRRSPDGGRGFSGSFGGNSDGEGKPITQLDIPPRDAVGLGILAASLIGAVAGARRASWLLTQEGTCFACLGATPEICHASDGKIESREDYRGN